MNSVHHFIEPLDVLILRGNKLFGDPGSYGESLVPPWPSVAAGALRSALLAHKGVDPVRFARGGHEDPELGTPERPGSFVLAGFQLGRQMPAPSDDSFEPLYQPPADLVVRKGPDRALDAGRLRPLPPPAGIHCSRATSSLAVLAARYRGKMVRGVWLTLAGWKRHLAGRRIDPDNHLLPSVDLWQMEARVGVALDPRSRRAADGALFSTEAVALSKAEHGRGGGGGHTVGFLAQVAGAELPPTLALRFGGDGRAAFAKRVDLRLPEPDYDEIARSGRCRLILTSPGVFPSGWLPIGTIQSNGGLNFSLRGVQGRLSCAAVRRAEVVSGFDVAKGMPKPAQRVAPAGSVYWLEDLQATPEALRNLAATGLWSDVVENPARRAEGFNRLTFAAY